ncbi:zinc finger, CCHC-type containing protein [Tanacetum coccineum]
MFRNPFSPTTIGDKNPIRTLGDYSKPSHEGYRNTIELLVGNNVVPVRSDTIRLVQNGCSFHGLWSEDPNQHLKDFLKLMDSLDLDGENRERTRLHLFQFSLRDQASKWLERLPVGSITTWEDLTTCFLAQFFPPGRTAKLRNDILIFQQHHGESLSEAWTRFKDLLQKVVPMKLSIAWKIPSKPLLNTHPRLPMKRDAHSKEANISQTSLLRPEMEIETQQTEEPEPTLEDEFQDLHLNLLVFEVLAHALIYNAILDKYVESLELCKNGSTFVQGEVHAKWKTPGYSPYLLNIGLLEEIDHIFGLADGTKSYPVGIVKDVEVHIGKLKLLNDFYVIDLKKDPETPLLVGIGFLATTNVVIDSRMAKIVVGEGITRLYLMRRSLEVLRKFHWIILGGRFNQLSHVSSPLLSKPGEY